jgi:hypothetical protein
MRINAIDNFRVLTVKKIDFKDYDPAWVPKWAATNGDKENKKDAKKQA